MPDPIDASLARGPHELEHAYGDNVHLLTCPTLLTELAELSQPGCAAPRLTALVRSLYEALFRHVVSVCWPRQAQSIPTSMAQVSPAGIWRGEILTAVPTIIVDIARAGTVPAQTCFELLGRWQEPRSIRQDHLSMARTLDASGAVAGASLAGSTIGGPVADRWLVIPDPMGATGSSMAHAIDTYIQRGPPRRIITLHLMVTPEYLATLRARHPQAEIFALRLDRGLSPEDVLAAMPGRYAARERGLTDNHYIVPGAGGLGELLNNADV